MTAPHLKIGVKSNDAHAGESETMIARPRRLIGKAHGLLHAFGVKDMHAAFSKARFSAHRGLYLLCRGLVAAFAPRGSLCLFRQGSI